MAVLPLNEGGDSAPFLAIGPKTRTMLLCRGDASGYPASTARSSPPWGKRAGRGHSRGGESPRPRKGVFDYIEFDRLFAFGDMFCDFNGDGDLDFFDFLAFHSEFVAGCP